MNTLSGNWEAWLPKSYQWLKNVEVTALQSADASAWHVVPVNSKNGKLEVLADLADAGLLAAIEASLQANDWAPSDRTMRLVVDGYKVLAVAKSSVKVSASQLARQLGLDAGAALAKVKNSKVAFLSAKGLKLADIVEGFCQAIEEANYFKKGSDKPNLPQALLVAEAELAQVKERVPMIQALIFTKWLQDAPANFMNPEQLATISESLFAGKAELEILGRKQMEELGMGALISVSAGAEREPKMITMKFKGKDASKTVALVGKGVTFDAGGISMKPAAGMDEMKYDMSGAAAVLGAAHYFSEAQPAVNVVCAIGATENLPSGTATRPGDIVTSLSGKTIEILNTDAEGRLVLADVLTHTINTHKPQLVLDIATLTGAVLFALGHTGAAYMTPDAEVDTLLKGVSEASGERLWPLPLWPELESETSSELADLKNIAKPNVKAGTVMGGWFLHEFVKDGNCQWAHIDIAGAAWSCNAVGYHKSGGSAFGLRTLVGACEHFAGK
jgi:leucyl aminopeptidase